MSNFQFTELTSSPLPDIVTACLGTAANAKLVQADVGKPVKLGVLNNYVVCTAGDEIEGFVDTVDIGTYNDGFSWGGVIKNKRKVAKVDAAQVGAIGIRSLVVAGASAALGTADAYPKVKSGSPTVHLWRVISIVSGTGVAGDLVLIERI
jgi:hypothetical protein